jgi:hypothetical protein
MPNKDGAAPQPYRPEVLAQVLAEAIAEMDRTDESWEGLPWRDTAKPSFEDYLADIERRFNFILNDGKEE